MCAWPFPRKAREPQDRSGAADRTDSERPIRPPASPYSDQYETIIAQGHERPTPSFGAPALIWHVAIWPRRRTDAGEDCDPNDTAGAADSGAAKRTFQTRRQVWIDGINQFLEALQKKSAPRPNQPQAATKRFRPILPHEFLARAGQDRGFVTPFKVLERETLSFTLWWPDTGDADPMRSAMRVRVHAELNADYACFSFYMDIGQPWNEAHSASRMLGARRSRLLAAAHEVCGICEQQFAPSAAGRPAPVDLPAVPEVLLSAEGRTTDELDGALRGARNLLYVDAWEDFCAEFGCGLNAIAGANGEVFANFRGVVLATAGMPTGGPIHVPQSEEMAWLGSVPFPHFSASDRFSADGAEANAVVKAFWPLVRRITPRADYREFIACGVLDWRAIYITALGSSSQYVKGEERVASDIGTGEALIRVAPALLPQEERSQAAPADGGLFDSLVHCRHSERGGNNHPVRYLLLTKHAPHPRQIGRIAERINTMGTMRLFALKDWAAVRNADPYIRILGQDLDQITETWSSDKNLINKLTTPADIRSARADIEKRRQRSTRGLSGGWTVPELRRLEQILPRYIPASPVNLAYKAVQWLRFHLTFRRRDYVGFVRQLDEDLVGDVRHSALYHISNNVETRLLQISSRLDELGKLTVGGLHFRLNRSAYYVREFEILLQTLQVRNIPTWVSYEQFVRRGLAPAFDYMSSVGQRLRAVRERLVAVTEMIETSALVGQSAATRHNTAVLRQTTTLAIVLLTLYVTRTLIGNLFGVLFKPLYRLAPGSLREIIDKVLVLFQ
jgi:hypothetical protein